MAGESILVVDDNLINLKLVKVLLSVEGYEVHTATDATETLDLLTTLKPRLILMDIQLPGMDGLALTKKIKNNPKYQDVKIIALTAYAMKGDREKILAAGCDGYIAKPIDTELLPKLIERYLQDQKV